MNFSTLSSNERLAAYGAIAAIVGTLLTMVGGGFYGGAASLWITLLLAIAMLAIVFMPQWSPNTNLPGSKGSLMLVVGAIAGIGALLAILVLLPLLGLLAIAPLFVIGLLLGIVGGLVMGWAGWQEFQAEGGKFQLGSSTTGSGGTSRPAGTTGTTSAGAGGGMAGGTAAGSTEGGMGTGAASTGASAPTATTTEGMGSTGPASTTVGSTSAGSTDMGQTGGGAGDVGERREGEDPYRNP